MFRHDATRFVFPDLGQHGGRSRACSRAGDDTRKPETSDPNAAANKGREVNSAVVHGDSHCTRTSRATTKPVMVR